MPDFSYWEGQNNYIRDDVWDGITHEELPGTDAFGRDCNIPIAINRIAREYGDQNACGSPSDYKCSDDIGSKGESLSWKNRAVKE